MRDAILSEAVRTQIAAREHDEAYRCRRCGSGRATATMLIQLREYDPRGRVSGKSRSRSLSVCERCVDDAWPDIEATFWGRE